MVILFLVFQETTVLFSTAAATIPHAHPRCTGFQFLHIERGRFKTGEAMARSCADREIEEGARGPEPREHRAWAPGKVGADTGVGAGGRSLRKSCVTVSA